MSRISYSLNISAFLMHRITTELYKLSDACPLFTITPELLVHLGDPSIFTASATKVALRIDKIDPITDTSINVIVSVVAGTKYHKVVEYIKRGRFMHQGWMLAINLSSSIQP